MEIITEVISNEDKTIVYQYDKTSRFAQKGARMYHKRFRDVLEGLSKKEALMLIDLVDMSDKMTAGNVLKVKRLSELFPDVDRAVLSRFKKKLYDLGVLDDYRGRFMLNPFLFKPRNDKNIRNFQYLVQQAWLYLFVDKDRYVSKEAINGGLVQFIDEELFAL